MEQRPRDRACFLVLPLLLCAGCESTTLQPPPARLTTGIVIFQNIAYGGGAAHVTGDLSYLRGYGSPCIETDDTGDDPQFSRGSPSWSNCISSVRVAAGWKAILYSGNNFKGDDAELTGDVPDLREVPGSCDGSFNDCVSSIRVFRR